MLVYRITRAKYAEKLDGKGAAQSDSNRWNSRGTEIIYTASSVALARAELSGHVNIAMIPDPVLVIIELDIVDGQPLQVLPHDWDKVPPSEQSKVIGDLMVKRGTPLCLKVPSRYDPTQYNYLINPTHVDFESKVRIREVRPLR